MKARYYIEDGLRVVGEFFEDQWFDRTRNVRTSGNVSLVRAGVGAGEAGDSEFYQPARPRHIRQALREIPVRDVREYSYVDLGSGKGRTLFVAAERPFRQITGVEFSERLHGQACANVRRFRWRKGGCRAIRPLHENAKDFIFPRGKLVLYLFNPFGAATMQVVLDNLRAAMEQEPRHVIVVLLWPRCADQVAALPGMQLRRTRKEYQIFEAAGE